MKGGSLDEETVVKTKMALRELASGLDLFLIPQPRIGLLDTFDNKILIQPQGKKQKESRFYKVNNF
jgi:hypothetical protein